MKDKQRRPHVDASCSDVCDFCGKMAYKTNGNCEVECYNKVLYGNCEGIDTKNVPASSTKIERNKPCPCGSGIKAKKCECQKPVVPKAQQPHPEYTIGKFDGNQHGELFHYECPCCLCRNVADWSLMPFLKPLQNRGSEAKLRSNCSICGSLFEVQYVNEEYQLRHLKPCICTEAYFTPHCDDGSCDLGGFDYECPHCRKHQTDYDIWWKQEEITNGSIKLDWKCKSCSTHLKLIYFSEYHQYIVKRYKQKEIAIAGYIPTLTLKPTIR